MFLRQRAMVCTSPIVEGDHSLVILVSIDNRERPSLGVVVGGVHVVDSFNTV